MHVCVYVCMYVCVYVCMCVCVYLLSIIITHQIEGPRFYCGSSQGNTFSISTMFVSTGGFVGSFEGIGVADETQWFHGSVLVRVQ